MFVSANIFQPLIDVFEVVLKFFHNTIGLGWGLSIVAMTIAIRALLIPLAFKQVRSMQEMQRHGPELKAIKDKYKDDKQRQQQEMMRFYKENKIQPLASCLPLAAQFPVFISLFYMLRRDLRANICPTVQPGYDSVLHKVVNTAHSRPCGSSHGAGFLFIHDLTNTAKGGTLIGLIVLYVGTQLLSTQIMQSPAMDQTQRRIMMFLPLLFVLFVINFPAGLLVYWITTNAWTIVQQLVIRSRVGVIAPAAAGAAAGGRTGVGASSTVAADGNGSGGGLPGVGGLGALLRGQPKETEPAAAVAGGRAAAPPPPPRKKKKRSGRRR